MTAYEVQVKKELVRWQKQMQRKPGILDETTKKLQTKLNKLLPEKVQQAITRAIKEMVRLVLFGAEFTTKNPVSNLSLEVREAVAKEKVNFYRKTASVEGGLTGAGGILLGLADFPLLLSLKMKLLFELSALYGHSGKEFKERLFMLHIFQLAFSSREFQRANYFNLVEWEKISPQLPADIHGFDWRTFQREYRDYLDLAKLTQLLPVIGAPVGAMVNYRLLGKLGETAMNAYRLRWFTSMQEKSVVSF
jgi:hypothetical protein